MIRATALALCAATPAFAQSLEGRDVLFRVETRNDQGDLVFISRDYIAEVGPGPEFSVAAEAVSGMVAVPVKVDIGQDRIDLSYAQTPPGGFAFANFNGYVLTFIADCVLFEGAKIDDAATTLPMTSEDVIIQPDALLINVSGRTFDQSSRIGIILTVTDCPLS